MVVSVGTMFSEVGLFWYSFKQSRVGQYHGFLGRKPVCISPLNTYSASIQGFPPLPSPHALIPTHSPQTPLTLVQELHHSDLLPETLNSSRPIKTLQYPPIQPQKTLPTASFSNPLPLSLTRHLPKPFVLPDQHSPPNSITTTPTSPTAFSGFLAGLWLYRSLMLLISQVKTFYTPFYSSFLPLREVPRLHSSPQSCCIVRRAHHSCR